MIITLMIIIRIIRITIKIIMLIKDDFVYLKLSSILVCKKNLMYIGDILRYVSNYFHKFKLKAIIVT